MYLMNDFFPAKKVKILKFVSMSAVTLYRNYVQYEGRCAVRIRYLFNTSNDIQYRSGTSSVVQESKSSSFGSGDTT